MLRALAYIKVMMKSMNELADFFNECMMDCVNDHDYNERAVQQCHNACCYGDACDWSST